jgi:hypothetical protein
MGKTCHKIKGVAKVAKIDASIHRKFDTVYGLKGYPHIVLIPAGKYSNNMSGLKDKKIYYDYD